MRGVPAVGEDTKLMAVRIRDRLTLVVAAAMVDRFINSREEYDEAKAAVKVAVMRRAEDTEDMEVYVNLRRCQGEHLPHSHRHLN